MPTGGYLPTFSLVRRCAKSSRGASNDNHIGHIGAHEDVASGELAHAPIEQPPPVADEPESADASQEPEPAPPPQPDVAARRGAPLVLALALACVAALAAVGGVAFVRGAFDAPRETDARAIQTSVADSILPVVYVTQFEAVGGDNPPTEAARRLAERLVVAFSRFGDIRVAGPSAPPPDAGSYLLRGRLTRQQDGNYRLGIALLAPGTREILLAREYPSFQPSDAEPAAADPTGEQSVVRALAIEIAQPLGVISADQAARFGKDPSSGPACLFIAQSYWRAPTRPKHAEAVACLTGAAGAKLPPVLAETQLSMLALDEYRNDDNPQPGPAPLDRALSHARAAIAAAPTNARAHQALMDALFLRGQTDEALRAGERALALNPLDMDILADYGARLVQSGRVREGRARLIEAADALPIHAPWHDFYLTLSAILLGDDAAALAHAQNIVSDSDPLSLLACILTARAAGAQEQLEACGRKLTALDPRYLTQPRDMLARRAFSPDVLALLTAAVESATRSQRSENRAAISATAG